MAPGLRVHHGGRASSRSWRGLVTPQSGRGEPQIPVLHSLSVLLRAGPNPGDYNIHIHSRSLLQFKSFWKRSLRPVRRCVSMVILNPGKLTVTVKCHSDEHVFCEQCGDGSHPVRVRLKEVGCPCSWLVPLSRQNPSTKTAQRVFSRLAPGRLGSPDCF